MPIDEAPYAALLSAHVTDGRVDYRGFAADGAKLDAWLVTVANAPADEPLGFWIDAYNALVIDAILAAPVMPPKITDVTGFFDVAKYRMAGRLWTLNQAETYLRGTWNDPRVHFALNCGAKSCPKLAATPYPDDPVALDARLESATVAFLGSRDGVFVDHASKKVWLSRLFEWYAADFKPTVPAFISAHAADPAVKQAISEGYAIDYQGYSWIPNAR